MTGLSHRALIRIKPEGTQQEANRCPTTAASSLQNSFFSLAAENEQVGILALCDLE